MAAEPSLFPVVLSLMIASAGIMLLATVQMLVVGLFTKHKSLYLSFAAMAFTVASYQAAQVYSLHSPSVEEAILGLKWQTAAAILFLPSTFLFIATYTQQKDIRRWFLWVLGLAFGLFLLNLYSPFSIRYTQIDSLSPFIMNNGETFYLLKGEQSWTGKLFHILSQVLLVWLFYRCFCLYQQQRQLTAGLLFFYLIIQLATAIYSALIDWGKVDGFYVAGFSFTALVLLMTVAMAYDFKVQNQLFRKRTKALIRATDERKRAESYNKKWVQVVDQTPSALIILSMSGRVIRSNQACEAFWGSDLSEADFFGLLNINEQSIKKEFDSPDAHKMISLHLLQGVKQYGLTPLKEAWVRFSIYPVRDESEQICEIIISHWDASDEEYAKQAIKNIAAGVSASSDKAFFDDLVVSLGQLFQAKYAFIGLLDDTAHQSESITTFSLAADGETVDNITYALKGTPCEGVIGQDICTHECGVQALYPDDLLLQEMGIESYIGAPIFAPDGTPLGIMVILDTKPLKQVEQTTSILEIFAARAGSEIQRLNAETLIRRMAYEDYLTQLPNRAQMHEHLHTVLKQSQQESQQAAMFLIDLDHFKTINDALGHDVGDEIIRKVGERLRQKLDPMLFIARVGGDEFVVIDSDNQGRTDIQAQVIADQLLYLLLQPIQVGDRILNIGASIGVVRFPKGLPSNNTTELDLLRYADIALYQAKNAGRNNYVMFEPGLQKTVNERLEIERGLREALDQDQLRIYMQPQVNGQGIFTGAEVLVRWLHPEKGLIPPFKFIPVAEETGLILRLGHWVFDNSLKQLAIWQSKGINFNGQLSINISAWQFAQQDFADMAKSLIKQRGIDPKTITLEVTETALLTDIEETRLKLELLRAHGFKVSLDDFGTGYSSLAYLKDLPLDELKIDKAFVDELKPGEKQPLIESMLSIGTHMQLEVIAEGVETETQRQQLSAMGCERFQGYLFAKPMPAEELPAWLEQNRSDCNVLNP